MIDDRILVIKLGALGDVIQALGPIAAIRRHHPNADLHILTTAPFADLLRASGYVDQVLIDERPGRFDVGGWLRLRQILRQGGYQRVYDLQTSGRSNRYYRLFWPDPRPEWSGIAKGCSHPHDNPDRDLMHTIERQAEQLQSAGIATVPLPDLSPITTDLLTFDLPARYAVLVPGGAAHRPEKRWPVKAYAALADHLQDQGVTPVVVGSGDERPLALSIPAARDLTGQTSLIELVAVLRDAEVVIGNDSGPMHIAAVHGIPSVVLFSGASDPALCAPLGKDVTILRRERLDDLPVADVIDAVS